MIDPLAAIYGIYSEVIETNIHIWVFVFNHVGIVVDNSRIIFQVGDNTRRYSGIIPDVASWGGETQVAIVVVIRRCPIASTQIGVANE